MDAASLPLEFGLSITPNWQRREEVDRLAQVADQAGLELVGIQDHPYQWRFFETWTLIAYLAGTTSRVRFFPDVASLPLRPPAMLAKAAASLDVLSGSRVELALGRALSGTPSPPWEAPEERRGRRWRRSRRPST